MTWNQKKMRIVYKVMFNTVMYKRFVRKYRETANVEYWTFYVSNTFNLANKGLFSAQLVIINKFRRHRIGQQL